MNFVKGLELTHREKESLLRENVVMISFVEEGSFYEYVTSIGMLEEANIDWRSEKFRVFGVEVEDITLGRLIGVNDPEPSRNTSWEDMHGEVWSFDGKGWMVGDTPYGAWPRVESAFPMKRVKNVKKRATV